MKKWISRLMWLSILVDIGFAVRFGWSEFMAVNYWKGAFLALAVFPFWWLIERLVQRRS